MRRRSRSHVVPHAGRGQGADLGMVAVLDERRSNSALGYRPPAAVRRDRTNTDTIIPKLAA